MAMSDSYEPYTLGKILKEALKLLPKSMKLSFPIYTLTFVYFSFLFMTNTTYTSPLLQDLTSKLLLIRNKDPNGSLAVFIDNLVAIADDLKQIIIIEAISSFVSFIIVLLLLISLAYTFCTAYSDKPLSVKGLLKIIDKRWYETLVTKLYIVILSLGYGVLMGSIIGVFMLMTKSSNLISMMLAFFALCLYIYLFTRWQLSLLVTVNQKSYGIGALSVAVLLYKGNMKRGCIVTYIALLVQCAIYGAFLFIQNSMKVENLIGIELGFLALSLMWNIYILAVYTVYYFECRKSHGIVDHEEGDQFDFKYYWSDLLPSTTKV